MIVLKPCLLRPLLRKNIKSTITITEPVFCHINTIDTSSATPIQYRHYAKSYRKNNIKNNKFSQPKDITFNIPNFISVNKFSNLLNCRVQTLIKDLTNLGFENITNEYILSREYIELILQEYNYKLPESTDTITSKTLYYELKQPSKPKLLKPRPPIVTIMGHVDHGKTTIIDYLQKSSVVNQEHGGITQHIGAFQVTTPETKKKITFLDTPGHSAFLKMRERGANITDIIILVVSIEDSIMPQTLEAIKHIKHSGNELIVAITKIDKFSKGKERDKHIDKVNMDLMNNEINVEKMGGDVQVIPISAKTGENMDLLEESIITLSDIMDIRAENSNNTMVQGWIVESQVKSSVGNIATVLIKKGTLKKGKIILCGDTYCRVKSMVDSTGKSLNEALPAQAIKVLGWKFLPQVGDEIIQVKSESVAKKYINKKIALEEVENNLKVVDRYNENKLAEYQHKEDKKRQYDDENIDEESTKDTTIHEPKKVNFIIKSDVSGSAEAVRESIENLGNLEVKCNVISSSVGIPTESDLKMADLSSSTILCFNLESIPNNIMNNKLGIPIRNHNVIYELIDDVINKLVSQMEPKFEKKIVATVAIKSIFEYKLKKKIIKIAGCKVSSGEIKRDSKIYITRGANNKEIYEGNVETLKHGKDDIKSATKGNECGITFTNRFEDFQSDDKINVYDLVELPRHL